MTIDDVHIRDLASDDWPAVARIYAAGLATGHATFETEVPDWDEWDGAHLPDCRIVAASVDRPGKDGLLGWAALTPVSGRCVYAGVAEVSVYVDPEAQGRGVGTALLADLVSRSEVAGLWTLQAGIFKENAASIRIHEKCGFRLLGIRERLGRMNGVWRDVAFLERRSPVID